MATLQLVELTVAMPSPPPQPPLSFGQLIAGAKRVFVCVHWTLH